MGKLATLTARIKLVIGGERKRKSIVLTSAQLKRMTDLSTHSRVPKDGERQLWSVFREVKPKANAVQIFRAMFPLSNLTANQIMQALVASCEREVPRSSWNAGFSPELIGNNPFRARYLSKILIKIVNGKLAEIQK